MNAFIGLTTLLEREAFSPLKVREDTQKIEGCRFADRCKYATAACKKAQKMREVTPGHFIRCCRFDPPQSNT